MPMRKAMQGGKVSNKGKYKHGGRVKKGHGGSMTIIIKKNKKKK